MNFTVMEELWFGKVSDEEAEQKAAQSLAVAAAQVYGLRPFPSSAQKLISASRNPNFKVTELSSVIEQDPTLAARVLRLINSAAYSLVTRCVSVSHAVTLLGARSIGELGAAVAVLDMFKEKAGPAVEIREHNAQVATLSRQLAVLCAVPADDVFTCGLLHDLGKLLILQVREAEYSKLLEESTKQRDSAHILEREKYGYDHAVLAAHILKAWKIPDPVPQVVAWHHQAARAHEAGGQVSTMVSIVRLADRLTYDLQQAEKADEKIIAEIASDEAAVRLGFSVEKLTQFWDNLQAIAMEGKNLAAGGEVSTSSSKKNAQVEKVDDEQKERAKTPSVCSVCGQPASEPPCPRCGERLCAVHQPSEELCCDQCELEYDEREEKRGSDSSLRLGLGAAFAAVAALCIFFAFFLPGMKGLLLLAALFIVAPFFVLPAVARAQVAKRRRAFIAEHPRREQSQN